MLARTRLWGNRLWWLSPKFVLNRLSLACVITVFICGAASAQIKFVQITDPHLYDDGQEANDNKRALMACVTKIDKLIGTGADYKFVVVTGDIGIEKLVKPLLAEKKPSSNKEEIDRIDRAINLKITGAALEVANMIGQSRVKVWLFLPGNNDLIDEKTETINYYRDFMVRLREALPGKEVIDLCPTDDPSSGVYVPEKGFVFIGFNNASFKNNNEAVALVSNGTNIATMVATTNLSNLKKLTTSPRTDEQLNYVQQVIDRVDRFQTHPVYILYHIPEIDDPYPVRDFDYNLLNSRKLTLSDQYALSSWFVDGRVRERWSEVVAKPNVRGLFAGHFHDWRRDTYENFRWMVTSDYPGASLSKLYVCPPISIKRQGDQGRQARGFQAVSIDGTGKVSVNVFWYDGTTGTFVAQNEKPPGSGENPLIFASVIRYVWGSIPSYLPFYLTLVVCGYALYKGRKRATVISPFHLPSDNKLPFGERTVANVLQDALVGARKDAVTGIAERSGQVIGVGPQGMTGLKLPEVRPFEVSIQFAVEVKGLSHEALISLARKVLRRERAISGDVIVVGKEFQLLARSREKGPWTVELNQSTPEGLQRACRQLALNMLEDFSPTLLAAHDIAEGRFEVAYHRLKELIYAD